MGIDGGNEVEQAGDDNEHATVVRGNKLNGRLAERKHAGSKIEKSGPEIADKSEDAEEIAARRHVEAAPHGNTE